MGAEKDCGEIQMAEIMNTNECEKNKGCSYKEDWNNNKGCGPVLISPSILAADFAHLGDDVADVCARGIDFVHIDVMDGAFVPNISFGADVMKSLIGIATVPFDVHLMINDPDRYIENFVNENTEYITVHYEACSDLRATLDHIHSLGVKAGVSIKPATPPEVLDDYLDDIDMVLVMSVEPGFGGQKFMPESLDKIRYYAEKRVCDNYSHGSDQTVDSKEKNISEESKIGSLNYLIEVDGGVGAANAHLVREAGIDVIVAGSAVFRVPDRTEAIRVIKGL